GKIRNTMLGKISGVFSLIMGVLTIASGVLIAIFPERTEILALVYLAVLSVLLIIMIILTNKLNK
ncbi:MAG TPA: hypothetical protein VFC68_02140, partial [Treponemataceae bacterium]|nr:hypothetical protein [Treponemataceae bacterium]